MVQIFEYITAYVSIKLRLIKQIKELKDSNAQIVESNVFLHNIAMNYLNSLLLTDTSNLKDSIKKYIKRINDKI